MSFSNFARHAMAAVSAVVITGMLMVHSLAASPSQVHSVLGVLA